MTSFQTSGNAVKPDIFTFKVQGFIYHRVGSLMAEDQNDAKFLQIYFMGSEEEELRKRNQIIPETDIELLRELQNMLHTHNEYIKIFKTAMECDAKPDKIYEENINCDGLKSRNVFPISSLNPFQSNWQIMAKVMTKRPIFNWKNKKGEGKLFNMVLCDESAQIRVTIFKDLVDRFYDKIEIGKVYLISNAD